jgi:glycerophosphoryl diester phosphodiesterase
MPPFQDQESATELQSRPLVIAHRGASGLAPENTLAAFKLAAALGADGVELDVRLSADRRAVVMHDARVNRTTTGAGPVSSFTAEQLGQLDAGQWFERRIPMRPRARTMAEQAAAFADDGAVKFSSETVPTLESVLALLSQARLRRIYIELKDRSANKEHLLEQVITLARHSNLEDSITLLSFDHGIIRRAKQLDPDIRAAATIPFAGARLMTARAITRAVADSRADEAALHFGLATKRLADRLHESGLSVAVWTANNKLVMRRLIACGVDSIMTNFPDRLIEVLNSPSQRRIEHRRNGRKRG